MDILIRIAREKSRQVSCNNISAKSKRDMQTAGQKHEKNTCVIFLYAGIVEYNETSTQASANKYEYMPNRLAFIEIAINKMHNFKA